VLPASLKRAWPIDPKRGIETREVAPHVYVTTDGVWQSAFVVTSESVIVLDAPQSYGNRILEEVHAVTPLPVSTLVYTHAHTDHIGGSGSFRQVEGLEILALEGVAEFIKEQDDPMRLLPTRTFSDQLVLDEGGLRIELQEAHYHSDEGDLIVYIPESKFLMAVDTLAPGYVPFMGFDITSNFHAYLGIFDKLLAYEFDVFVGGHLTHPGDRKDVELTRDFTVDVYETTRRIHAKTDLMKVFSETAKKLGSWDNKYLMFRRFLDEITAEATVEIEERWADRLAGVDVWTEHHVRTALVYIRWDD